MIAEIVSVDKEVLCFQGDHLHFILIWLICGPYQSKGVISNLFS